MVTEDDDGAGARCGVVRGSYGAAHERLGAEDTEVIAGNQVDWSKDGGWIPGRSVLGGEMNAGFVSEAAVCGDPLKRAGIRLQLTGEIPGKEAVGAKIDAAGNACSIVVSERYQLLRIANGKVAEHDLVDEREDRSVSADAEGEREECNGGEAGTLGQHAEADARVLKDA